MGSLVCFCTSFGRTLFNEAILLLGFEYTVVLVAFISVFRAFDFGEGSGVLSLGLPLGRLGDEVSSLSDTGLGWEDECNLALAFREPNAVRLFPSQHLSNRAII
jgi:hypothetical protein